ncbi:hypothetical protein Salat_2581100 [Sesamum alatum]|uniref:Uncharacterized protein n=1 Tax=Sesamum alatum TaxID=300844 RepID=A0AAE1XMR1_9LAMI|nr:hypothetical protein Salat_2581100 [Sesamum alatum]
MQAQESDLTEVSFDKQKAGGFGYVERPRFSVNPDSAIANSPGVRSVGWASVELFDGVAKGNLRTTPSPSVTGQWTVIPIYVFLDPPFLLLVSDYSACTTKSDRYSSILPSAVLLSVSLKNALSSDGISTDNAGGWTASRRIHEHLCYLPFFTEETSEALPGASCVLPMLRDNGGASKTFACLEAHAAQQASRAKPNHYSQETHGRDVLEANVRPRPLGRTQPRPAFQILPPYHKDHCPATARATEQNGENSVGDRGKEKRRKGKEWKRLRERFAKESCGAVEKFPVGVSDPAGLHLLVEEVGFLDIKVSRQSKKDTSGSNRCFDHDSLAASPCLLSLLAGFGQFYLLLGFEPMSLADEWDWSDLSLGCKTPAADRCPVPPFVNSYAENE